MHTDSHVRARVSYHFLASPERVFDAWLDRFLVARWFGPGLGDMVQIDIEPRIGGMFSFVQRRGDQDVDHVGEYLELERPRRLAFTWAVRPDVTNPSRVVIDIRSLESGCVLTLTHEMSAEWADYVSRTEGAWAKMLAAMAQALG